MTAGDALANVHRLRRDEKVFALPALGREERTFMPRFNGVF